MKTVPAALAVVASVSLLAALAVSPASAAPPLPATDSGAASLSLGTAVNPLSTGYAPSHKVSKKELVNDLVGAAKTSGKAMVAGATFRADSWTDSSDGTFGRQATSISGRSRGNNLDYLSTYTETKNQSPSVPQRAIVNGRNDFYYLNPGDAVPEALSALGKPKATWLSDAFGVTPYEQFFSDVKTVASGNVTDWKWSRARGYTTWAFVSWDSNGSGDKWKIVIDGKNRIVSETVSSRTTWKGGWSADGSDLSVSYKTVKPIYQVPSALAVPLNPYYKAADVFQGIYRDALGIEYQAGADGGTEGGYGDVTLEKVIVIAATYPYLSKVTVTHDSTSVRLQSKIYPSMTPTCISVDDHNNAVVADCE